MSTIPEDAAAEASVKLTINGTAVRARHGQSVLETANANGIKISTLCHHNDLTPAGSCRLCVVEIEGWRTEVAACAVKVAPGMVVRTETPRIEKLGANASAAAAPKESRRRAKSVN